MGIWIRSQNRKFLVESKNIGIKQNTTSEQFIEDFVNDKKPTFKIINFGTVNTVLGEYTTEERAMDVLDCIQYQIVKGYKEDVIVNGTRIKRESIFQIPEE